MKNEADRAVPPRRTKDLVVRVHGEEVLVLDRRTGTVHCLPAGVALVWGACTGRATLAEIASAAGIDEEEASAAVDQIMRLDLLEAGSGFDRRKFLRRSALTGVGVATVIESVVALPARAAASPPEFGDITFVPSCVGTKDGDQAQFYVNFSHGTPGLKLLLVATSDHPGGGQPITVTSTGFSLDGNGNANSPSINIPDTNYEDNTGTSTINVFGVATPITITVFDEATGDRLGTFTGTIGPCYHPSDGVITFTSTCGSGGQSQWSAVLDNFDGLAIITVRLTATNARGQTVTDEVMVTTANNGTANISLRDFGSPGDFPDGTTVTVEASEGGRIFHTEELTVVPCPLPPAAGASARTRTHSSSRTRSRTSSSTSTPSRSAPSTAPTTSPSTTPTPGTTPSASPSPSMPPASPSPKPSRARGRKP